MRKTICLNMIVKNESSVIARCLISIKNLIDHWVIVDTGSTDGTQKIIQECLKDVPGELHERSFVDFATSRNMAFDFAKNKADYLFFLDADQYLVPDDGFSMPHLKDDAYYLPVRTDTQCYYQISLVNAQINWKWEGVLHEALFAPASYSKAIISGLTIIATSEGYRSQNPNKYLDDAAILEEEIKKDPTNARNVFFLGMSYAHAGKYEAALQNFEKRVSMGGDEEQVYVSMLTIGQLQEFLNMDPNRYIDSYTKAYLYRPSRAESLFCLARYFIKIKNDLVGYLVSKLALAIPYPQDIEFVRFSIYDYEILLQYAECAYSLGKIDETVAAYEKIIKKFEEYLTKKQLSSQLINRISSCLPEMAAFIEEHKK